mgnify:CR=1 FL=1
MSKLDTALSALKAVVNGMPDEVIDTHIRNILDRCEESMCCIMDYSVIETGDDDEEFLIPESNFPKMELQDDGTLIFIEIEDEKQLGLYKQLQPRWNFLSRIEFNETGVTNEVASTE